MKLHDTYRTQDGGHPRIDPSCRHPDLDEVHPIRHAMRDRRIVEVECGVVAAGRVAAPNEDHIAGTGLQHEREVLQCSSETSECVIILGCRQSGDLGTGNPLSVFRQLFVAPDQASDSP